MKNGILQDQASFVTKNPHQLARGGKSSTSLTKGISENPDLTQEVGKEAHTSLLVASVPRALEVSTRQCDRNKKLEDRRCKSGRIKCCRHYACLYRKS